MALQNEWSTGTFSLSDSLESLIYRRNRVSFFVIGLLNCSNRRGPETQVTVSLSPSGRKRREESALFSEKEESLPPDQFFFTVLVPQNPPIDEFYVVQKNRWTDFEALELWKVRSGCLAPNECSFLLCSPQLCVSYLQGRSEWKGESNS